MSSKKLYPLENYKKVSSNILHITGVSRCRASYDYQQGVKQSVTYPELVEVPTENGVTYVSRDCPYPITPDYVKSFEASANYKNDVDGAIANGVGGANLGDLTGIQEMSARDVTLIRELLAKLNTANKVTPQADQGGDPQPDQAKNQEKGGE